MLVRYFDTKGKEETSKFTLKDSVFGNKVNVNLLAQAVAVYLRNQRQSNANTKNRGEVRGGGKKPWRQKGTGKARAGSSRSPIWKGGGVTFGPTNEINYKKRLNSKMIKKAIVCSLSKQAKKGNIVVYKGIEMKEYKTKGLLKILGDLGKEKTMIVQESSNKELFNAVHNIENVKLEVVNSLNYYNILNAGKIIILEGALENIYKYWDIFKKETKVIKKKEVVKKKIIKKKVVKKPVKKVTIKK